MDLDPETEAIVTLGSKEGLAHLALATTGPGDAILVPNPSLPDSSLWFRHRRRRYSPCADARTTEFFEELEKAIHNSWPTPKMLVLNFPSNPTTHCVELEFFEKVVAIAREYNIWVVQDLAYADSAFDGYEAPSILQVPGAKEVAVEFFSLSKSYNMPGWRVGFCCGNADLVGALARMKSYLDYGMFTPVQVAAISALEGDQGLRRGDSRDCTRAGGTCSATGSTRPGWPVEPPRATMFVWAQIPGMLPRHGFARVQQETAAGRQGGGVARHRLRRVRRRLCALRPDRERTSHPPGHTQNIKRMIKRTASPHENGRGRDVRPGTGRWAAAPSTAGCAMPGYCRARRLPRRDGARGARRDNPGAPPASRRSADRHSGGGPDPDVDILVELIGGTDTALELVRGRSPTASTWSPPTRR